jgi:hypothetical protein
MAQWDEKSVAADEIDLLAEKVDVYVDGKGDS